jgi:hypothetical protein
MPNDPQRGSAAEASLRASFRAMDRRREQHYAEWDAMLNAGRQKLDAKQGEAEATLERKIKELKQQMSDTLAELGDEDGPGEPPAQPPLPGERRLGPEEEATRIRDMPLGSEEHMRLRRTHGISKPFVL